MNQDIWSDYVFINSGETRKKILKVFSFSKFPITAKEIYEKLNQKHKLSQISNILKELSDKKLINSLNQERQYGNIYEISENGKEVMKIVLRKQFDKDVREYLALQGYIIKNVFSDSRVDYLVLKNKMLFTVIAIFNDSISDGIFKRRIDWLSESNKKYGAEKSIFILSGYFSKEQIKHDRNTNFELIDSRKFNFEF